MAIYYFLLEPLYFGVFTAGLALYEHKMENLEDTFQTVIEHVV